MKENMLYSKYSMKRESNYKKDSKSLNMLVLLGLSSTLSMASVSVYAFDGNYNGKFPSNAPQARQVSQSPAMNASMVRPPYSPAYSQQMYQNRPAVAPQRNVPPAVYPAARPSVRAEERFRAPIINRPAGPVIRNGYRPSLGYGMEPHYGGRPFGGRPFDERPLTPRFGRNYFERTFYPAYLGGAFAINRTYSQFVYGGAYFYVYSPVVMTPVFYSYVVTPWYRPVTYNFSWYWSSYGLSANWYYSYNYFVPYTVYAAPSYWVTDFVIADMLHEHHSHCEEARERARETLDRIHSEDAADAAAAQLRDIQAIEARIENSQYPEQSYQPYQSQQQYQQPQVQQTQYQDYQQTNTVKTSTEVVITTEVKETIRVQVEEELKFRGNERAPSLVTDTIMRNKGHIFAVSEDFSATTAADPSVSCKLSGGDLIQLAEVPAANDVSVKMLVIASKSDSTCKASTQIIISIEYLQNMANRFSERVDDAVAAMQKEKAANRLPAE